MAAGVWLRLKAFLLDYIWILMYLGFVLLLSMVLLPGIQGLFTGPFAIAQLTGFLLVTLPVSLYFAIGDSKRFAGTFGKQKMGIQVTVVSGDPIGFFRSLWRVALKFLPWELSHFLVYRLIYLGDGAVPMQLIIIGGAVYALMFAYVLSAFFSKEKRSVYDVLSGTRVIQKRSTAIEPSDGK